MAGRFRKIVRLMRQAAGLSQAKLARRLGTTQSAIARWETGEVSPRLDTLARIADACGLEAHVTWATANLAPSRSDPVIEVYKKDIDRTLLRENLKLTVEERLVQLQKLAEFADSFRGSARRRA
jgi:transcriptional regulator with XRE-family HTH domain